MTFNLNKLMRENIKNLVPYSSARKEFAGAAEIFLDANENSFGSPTEKSFNRYPDPLQTKIKERIAHWHNLSPEQIFVGNGSDEAIDLLFRVFCQPGNDEIITTPPTYGMYEVSANIIDVRVKKVLLSPDFELSAEKVLDAVSENTKLIFLCSPNNPTGNSLNEKAVLKILENFDGIVIVDEAYADFSDKPSFVSEINNFPNLVVLQTFSKAWGLAGLRVGMAFADAEIITLLNKVKPPYNVSQIAQETLLAALDKKAEVEKVVAEIVRQRADLAAELQKFSFVTRIYPSDANFLLIKTSDANRIYKYLVEQKIVVRNRTNVELCAGCLRITVGTAEENQTLLAALKNYE
ncbi:MAG TPA: histidinol-phosphate transaminase [Pyrinomonadaceae bacterium]|nr:histidinol-phosphate transaminase [Pyrinomonadaceae bacterium]